MTTTKASCNRHNRRVRAMAESLQEVKLKKTFSCSALVNNNVHWIIPSVETIEADGKGFTVTFYRSSGIFNIASVWNTHCNIDGFPIQQDAAVSNPSVCKHVTSHCKTASSRNLHKQTYNAVRP